MNEKIALALVDLFRPLYEKAGVDYEKMIEILRLKLLMDKRMSNFVLHGEHSEKSQREKNYFRINLIYLAFIGLMAASAMWYRMPIFIRMNYFLGMIIVLMLSMFISSYSSVLLDVKGKSIFYTRPLDEATVDAAKITHILIYIFSYAAALAIPGIAIGMVSRGVFFGGMIFLSISLISVFTVFLSGCLYFLLLKFFSGEKLKDILNYFQIGISIVIILSYQLFPRMIDLQSQQMQFELKSWMLALPSAWFAAPFELLFGNHQEPLMFVMAAMAVVFPLMLTGIYFRYVVLNFENYLEKLSLGESQVEHLPRRWRVWILWSGKNTLQRAFMEFVLINLRRDRNLKLRIVPQIVMATIFPLIFLANQILYQPAEFLSDLQNSPYYMTMYLTNVLLSSFYVYFTVSDYYKASEIYKVLPIKEYTDIYYAAFKLCIIKYILPVNLWIGGVFLFLYRGNCWEAILTVILNGITTFLLVSSFDHLHLPLSKPFVITKDEQISRMLINLLIVGCTAGIHFWGIYMKVSPIYILLVAMLVLGLSVQFFRKRLLNSKEMV